MTERWPKVLDIILAIVLVLVIVAYVIKGIETNTLQQSNDLYFQTVQHQTHLIVELRKELAGLHFRNFESEQELQSWVDRWTVTKMPIVLKLFDTDIVLRGTKYSEYHDCDDFGEAMQRDALRDGYLMDRALVDNHGTVYSVRVSTLINHVGATAIADNAYWFVEPQTGQIVRITRRD